MDTWLITTLTLSGYLAVALSLGWLAGRGHTTRLEDFFLYGRNAGPIVLYLAVVATYHSAFAFLGGPGFFYKHGLGFLDAGCWTLAVGGLTILYGPRIQLLAQKTDSLTPADLLTACFGEGAVRPVAALCGLVFSVLYIQVQAMGLGYILTIATGGRVPFALAVGLLMAVAALYVMAGGIRAVYWTDVLQGIWMYVAVWGGALFLIYDRFGGLGAFWDAVRLHAPDHLTLPGPEGFFTWSTWFSYTVIFSVGVFLQPHFLIRFFTARNPAMLRRIGAATPLYLTTLYIPIGLVGLAGVVLLPELATADQVFPELLFRFAPAWLTGLVLAGAAAASMSTMDAILHANALILSHDLYGKYVAPGRPSAHYVAAGRWAVGLLLGVSFLLCLTRPDFLVHLVALSASGAMLVWPGVQSTLYPGSLRLGRRGLLWGIGAGAAVLAVLQLTGWSPLGLHGAIWSTLVNLGVGLAVTRWTGEPEPPGWDRLRAWLSAGGGGGR